MQQATPNVTPITGGNTKATQRKIAQARTTLPDYQTDGETRAYFRIWQIIGDKKRHIEPLLPIGRTTFLNGVKSGKYPQPVKLGERTTAWRKSDIMALLDSISSKGAA